MTDYMSLEDYQRLTGQTTTKSKKKTKAARDNELATLTLITKLERNGLKFGGVWRKGMKADPSTIYLEYQFSDKRRFRADLAIPSESLLVEIHGGSWVMRRSKDGGTTYLGGAHHSPDGRKRDMQKARLANLEEWCYLEFDWEDVKDGTAFNDIQEYINEGRDDA